MREMERRAYRASTGRDFTLVRYEDPDARDPWPKSFWLYEWEEDGRRLASGAGFLTNRHRTTEAATERIEAEERIRTATEDLSETLSRAEYEAACQRAGIEPWSDEKIADAAYAITYGEFALPEYDVTQIIAFRLAAPRLRAIEAERPPAPAVQPEATDSDVIAPAGTTMTRASYGTGRCGRCGAEHSHWNPGAGEFLCDQHWDDY